MTPAESTYIPVKYYSLDTTMTLVGNLDRVANAIDDMGTESQIMFSTFLIDSQQYTHASNFYASDDKKTWDKILERDRLLTLAIKPENESQQRRKVMIAASIYRRKIFITNRGNQKETAHVFMIKLRPLMVVQNCLPRKIDIYLNETKEKFKIEPNERYIYKLPNRVDERTALRVAIA